MCGFDNRITQSDSKYFPGIVTIIVVGVVDVAGTYGSGVLPFMSSLTTISAASIETFT